MSGADSTPRVEVVERLDVPQVAAVVDLLQRAADADEALPVSEHVWLHLRHGGVTRARNVLVWQGAALAAYAHLDVADSRDGGSGELVVDPARRAMGLGRRLVEEMVRASPDGRLRLWSHGEHPGAARLAECLGFHRARALWQMRRSLLAPIPRAELPAGVTVRTFVVGADEDAWLEVNNRAFAGHPDQSAWTRDDLRMREQEDWFDPSGFFLAERDGRLVGFHWTKVHGGTHRHRHDDDEHEHTHDHDAIGEVYVVGVDPDAQGIRLGPALTRVGLVHLRQRGLAQAMLYVDETNVAAIRVYERLGFTRWSTDVSYTRSAGEPGATAAGDRG